MSIIGSLPSTFTNGQTADATQVMADLTYIVNQVNANAFPTANVGLFSSAPVGAVRNLYCGCSGSTSSATFTADEIIVETALGGTTYKLASFNKTINISTTGAGGMDNGSPPANGFVAIYAIYNPTTTASALLAIDASSANMPQVYSGAYMPSGYTASALISVVATVSSQFKLFGQIDRQVWFSNVQVLTIGANQSITTLGISAAVPYNAKKVSGLMSASFTSGTITATVSMSSSTVAQQNMNAGAAASNAQQSFIDIPINVAQTISYGVTVNNGGLSFQIYICGYTI
jgi:hypothetical protein